jgi:hypothetical protein
MSKSEAKHESPIDVLVLGEHPAGYLVAALLRHKSKLRIVHATIPDESPDDRLVTINPALFDLHPLLSGLRRKLNLVGLYGLDFLADDPATRSQFRTKSPVVFVTRYKSVRDEVAKIAATEGVEFITPKSLEVRHLDERGVDVTTGKGTLRSTALALAGHLPTDQQALLGLPDSWGPDVVHRFTYIRCKSSKNIELGPKPAMPMSLDLLGQLCWAWLVPGDGEFQLSVEHPLEPTPHGAKSDCDDGPAMLAHWVEVLKRHGVLNGKFEYQPTAVRTIDLPLAGALAQEGVANRTLLVGPAGGFFSACGEDIYPNCWSALFAADALKKAFREPHLQDALNPYRQKWRTTLGDYLRGPQHNLRFLLPLVYRNPVMTTRLAEAILLSKSVVR